MNLLQENFTQFAEENYEVLKTTLASQFEKHFNLLVEAVPSIKNIEWSSFQEDEMNYNCVFSIEKNNGHVFDFSKNEEIEQLFNQEFKPDEIKLIEGFKTYLDTQTQLIVTLFGSDNFKLENTQLVAKKLKM